MSTKEAEELFDSVTEVDDEVQFLSEDVVPSTTEPEWSEFVINQLHDSELVDGAPTVDGLRRFTQKYYANIVDSESDVIFYGEERCAVRHVLTVQRFEDKEVVTVSACVDVVHKYLPAPYNQHLLACADTRAEGKALRRLLKIRVITSEELQNNEDDDPLGGNDSQISDQQIMAINTMAQRNNVDVIALVNLRHPDVKHIKELNNAHGKDLIGAISTYQRDGVPETLSGYNSDWRDNFTKTKKTKRGDKK